MTSQTAFWDRLADEYYAQPIAKPDAYEQTLARVQTHLRPTDHALELGCGTGGTAIRLAPHVARWTATDISPGMLAWARRRLDEPGAPTNIEVQALEVDALELGETYDVVCAFNLLHLVPDLDTTLTAIARAVRPGGLVISKTPCLGEKTWFLRLMIPVMRVFGRAPAVVELFDHDALEQAFARQGFELVESLTFADADANRFLVMRAPA